MHANHETGVLQPVSEVAELLSGRETLLHTDATQTFGKDVDELRSANADLVSICGHKIFGPQGIEVLIVRGRAAQSSLIDSLRSQRQFPSRDNIPVALAVGLGAAAAIAKDEHQSRRDHALDVRRRFLAQLERIDHSINGQAEHCQPHVLNVSFRGIDSEALMIALMDEIAISNGAIRQGTEYHPNAVLTAMGLPESRVSEAVRFSWGPGVEEIPFEPIARVIEMLKTS